MSGLKPIRDKMSGPKPIRDKMSWPKPIRDKMSWPKPIRDKMSWPKPIRDKWVNQQQDSRHNENVRARTWKSNCQNGGRGKIRLNEISHTRYHPLTI